MRSKRHTQRVKKLMIHALNEAIEIGFLPTIPSLPDIIEAEDAKITVGGKNTVINWNYTREGDVQFNVWWDYTPERCGRFLRKGKLSDLRGAMPDVSNSTRPKIMCFCASCYLCVLEDGRIRLSREGEMIVEYARSDAAYLLDDLTDVEPSGYSFPGGY